MLKINTRFDHLVEVVSSACRAPLTFQLEWIIIIACCVLGLLWAAYNIWLVFQIDVKKGKTGDDEDEAKGRDISQHQKELLIELGVKISEVHIHFISGCQVILESRVLDLFRFCLNHVLGHYFLHWSWTQNRYRLLGRCHRFDCLWCHWYGYRHPNKF